MTNRTRTSVWIGLGTLCVAAIVAGGWVVRHGRSHPIDEAQPVARAAAASAAIPTTEKNPDPSFPTAEQARQYFGAVVDGERRALELVTASLVKARAAPGSDPRQIEQLQRLQSEYTQRLHRHQARLAVARH
jgi:hypothetical protein